MEKLDLKFLSEYPPVSLTRLMRWNPATIYIPKYRANVAASKNRDGWLVLAEECQEFNDFFQLAASSGW